MAERIVETVYCDDIRHEISGKYSLIGVYQSELIVQSFPTTLPKLCILIKVRSTADHLPSSLTLEIRKNIGKLRDRDSEEILRQMSVPKDDLAEAMEDMKTESGNRFPAEDRIQAVTFVSTFSPMHFAEACVLRVSAFADDEELRGPALVVRQTEESHAT